MFAVAIRAQWRLRDAAGQRLAVHAGAELLDHFGVAHAAGIGNSAAECLGFRGEQFVCAAVAQRAIRRAFVAAFAGLAMDAFIVVARLVGVAGDAGWFGDIRGMRNFLVRLVTRIAGERRVCALRQLLPLFVARGTFGSGVAGCVQIRAGDAGK